MSSAPLSKRPPARPASNTRSQRRNGAIRVMIVDDSLTVRTIIKRMVESDRAMVVAGTASSAEAAIIQLKADPVDVVLLDLDMPGIGGLAAMPSILEISQSTQVLVVSALTEDGAEHTVKALSMGAADTMLKPAPGGFNDEYRSLLLSKIKALGGDEAGESVSKHSAPDVRSGLGDAIPLKKMGARRPAVVAVGASTGGIHALNLFLDSLPDDFELPILITQHLPASFMPVFARQIQSASGRPTEVAQKGTQIRPGHIYVAPGEGHLIVRRTTNRLVCKISDEKVSSGCLPSVDPMLESLSEACEGQALAVLLSGMGRDGELGAAKLSAAGGTIFAQDAETCAVWGMPGAVSKAGLASLIASPEEIAKAIAAMPKLVWNGGTPWK